MGSFKAKISAAIRRGFKAMNNAVVGIGLGLFGLFFFLKSQGKSLPMASDEIISTDGSSDVTLDDLYRAAGREWGLDDWRLLKAIAIVESNENPNAVNPADPSTGLMQVLCKADGPDQPCQNKFNIQGWENATPNALFDPQVNLFYAAQILKWNQDTFGFVKGIAVYNNWSARTAPANGPFPNQGYVDKVLTNYNALTSSLTP